MPKRYIRRPDGTLIEDSGAVVDSSLTISGVAADAKAVGDELIKKLNADRLNGAVEDALRQAKESGEFDGDDYNLTDAVYLCVRNTGAVVYHALADLVGLYVESVNNVLYLL